MQTAYRKFRRGSVFYVENVESGKQESLRTKDEREADRLIDARNQAAQPSLINRALGRTYLAAVDPAAVKRTWQTVMEHFCTIGGETTRERRRREVNSPVYAPIRNKPLIETNADDLLFVMGKGGSAVNATLRVLHNLAVGFLWLPAPIITAKLWPKVKPRPKRAITAAEHAKILAAEQNEERRDFYQMLWETGAAQTDASKLTVENVDWKNRIFSYSRQKTGATARLAIGKSLETLLKRLPQSGPLFPTIIKTSSSDRAAEFYRRCKLEKIKGASLHSYRYGLAERGYACGYPERYAQAALGQTSRAVHHAYAKGAVVICPAMDSFEEKVIRLPESKPSEANATEGMAG